jgi:selT/selW/selH-like putative selenoprotein
MVATTTNIIWFGGIGLLFGGSSFFSTLGIQEPELYKSMKQNPVAAFMGLFVVNSFGASQLSTGAFEIYLDDALIYSKLETGRMPTGPDVIAALEANGLKPINM